MVWFAVQNLRDAGIAQLLAVVGHDRERVKTAIGEGVEWVLQEEQLGTGHAAAQAIPHIGAAGSVVVLFGDCPFLDAEIIANTLATHRDAAADLTIATARIKDPRALGQVCRGRDGAPERILDGRLEPHLGSGTAEVFAGLSVWRAETFREILPRLPLRRLDGGTFEQNLPDAVEFLLAEGRAVASYRNVNEYDAIAPNYADEFDNAGDHLRRKVRARLRYQGVDIHDPHTVIVDYDVTVGIEGRIGRNVHLLGRTTIGDRCEIGPDTTLRDCSVGDGCVIGRGSWSDQVFQPGAKASDRLAADQRHFRRPHFLIAEELDYCFVILPFHEPYKSLFANVILPTAEEYGLRCETADRAAPGVIFEDIWNGINRAGLVIAEVTEDKMNVWYELGLAHALNKKVVILRRTESETKLLPFDVAHQRVIYYDPERGDLRGLLGSWLRELSRPARKL